MFKGVRKGQGRAKLGELRCAVGIGMRRRGSDARGHDIEKDGEVVGQAARHDKYMPRSVEVAEAVEGKEDDAEGVGESAGGEPQNAVEADGVEERARCKNHKPTLKQIDKSGCDWKPIDGEAFEQDSGDGECPDHGEEYPADRAAKRDKSERGVGAGDEQVN